MDGSLGLGSDYELSSGEVTAFNIAKFSGEHVLVLDVLAMADEGIARDYVEYRKNNRDKLRRYLNEYVTAGK